jgi:hypothetical protein
MWDISRVIPACAVTGEAAGTAATIGDDMTALDTVRLQTCLVNQNVKLHWAEANLISPNTHL